MITRDNIVSILNTIRIQRGLNNNDEINILTEYCLERGKSDKDVQTFIQGIVMFPPQLRQGYIQDALNWYSKKYNIIKIIYNNQLINVY